MESSLPHPQLQSEIPIGASHNFQDEAFARQWAMRFNPTPSRLKLFKDIGDRIALHGLGKGHIVELGIGPGYLAVYLMHRFPTLTYTGVDSSAAMLRMATGRLQAHGGQFEAVHYDLLKGHYDRMVKRPADIIVSTWALHDLGSPENIAFVYAACKKILSGVLLNGDFIKPAKSRHTFEGGRFELKRHRNFLHTLGYRYVRVAGHYETNSAHPTSSNNYALIEGCYSPSEQG